MEPNFNMVGFFITSEIGDISVNATWSELSHTGSKTPRPLEVKDLVTFDYQWEITIPYHGVVLIKMTSQK